MMLPVSHALQENMLAKPVSSTQGVRDLLGPGTRPDRQPEAEDGPSGALEAWLLQRGTAASEREKKPVAWGRNLAGFVCAPYMRAFERSGGLTRAPYMGWERVGN